MQIFGQSFQRLATSDRYNSLTIQIDENSDPNGPSMGCPVPIFSIGRSKSFPGQQTPYTE